MSDVKCKDCVHFERGVFHECVGGGEQKGGECSAIAEVLGITNSFMWLHKTIHVQESFGCSLGRYK